MEIYSPTNTADLERSILWQDDNAENLKALIEYDQAFFDTNVTDFWNDYYTNIFNLDTANDFGLTVWGIILAVNWPSYDPGTGSVSFSSESYRTILKSRLLLNRMRSTIPNINKYMEELFDIDRRIEVIDNYDMTITYMLYFTPTDEESALLLIDDILPRPAGVEVIIGSVIASEVFGYSGQRLGAYDSSVYKVEV